MELGILHPEVGVKALQNRELPSPRNVSEEQERLAKERKEGKYNPLVGGVPMFGEPGDKTPTGNIPKPSGRPAKASINKDKLIASAKKFSEFEAWASNEIMVKKGLKSLSEDQASLTHEICKSVALSTEQEGWKKKFSDFSTGSLSEKNLEIKPEILEISAEFETDDLQAAMIYHAK